jgi:hypothetical protein
MRAFQSITSLSGYGRIRGSFKYDRFILAKNKGKELIVHKT